MARTNCSSESKPKFFKISTRVGCFVTPAEPRPSADHSSLPTAFQSVNRLVERLVETNEKRAARARFCLLLGGEGGIRTHGTLRYA